MRVLFVTPECAPLTKTGGLGDVSAALPAALRAQGIDVRGLMPAYRRIAPADARECAPFPCLPMEGRLLEAREFLLVDCPPPSHPPRRPYHDAPGPGPP